MPTSLGRGLAVALLLVAGWFLWPAALGGGTTYVGTEGISMQPMLHTGDLAVLRTTDGYRVGDVIGYRSPTLETTVLHRIVAQDGDAFVTEGDNNTWQDPDHPRADQILGRLWFSVPSGARVLAALKSPWLLCSLGLVAVAVTGLLGARRRDRGPRRAQPRVPATVRAQARRVTSIAGVVAVIAAAGGAAAFLAPAARTVPHPAEVTVRGAYAYEGSAEAGITYPDGRIATGDPVWLRLADGITVSLHQTVSGAGVSATGTLRLDLAVATPDGWSAPLASGSAAALLDGAVTASVPVDLTAAGDLARRHYAEVGTGRGDVTLTVIPVADVTGTVGGSPFTATALAPLTFSLSDTVLTLSGDAATSTAPTATVAVPGTAVEPTTVTVLGLTLPLGMLRGLACLALAAALVTLVAARAATGSDREDAAGAFVLRHRDRILPVTALPQGSQVVEVPDGAALHRLAERLDTFVLHAEGPDGHVFAVQDGPTGYRYTARPAPRATPSDGASGRHSGRPRRPAPTLRGLIARLALI